MERCAARQPDRSAGVPTRSNLRTSSEPEKPNGLHSWILLRVGTPALRWLLFLFAATLCSPAFAADKKIVLIAGGPSHGAGEHEYRAGCLLLQKCLNKIPGITTAVYFNGWPDKPDAFDGAAAILIYADGGDGHPALRGDR